ncbi:MAG TPA: hypothetical protein VGH44_00615 [Candidatus Saccharimonadia bacterium]|jgi:hypothetical protein
MSVRIAMGLAAAGGAIIALSGTAAAADVSGVNAPQSPQQTTANVPTPVVNNVRVPDQNGTSSTDVTNQNQTTVTPVPGSNDSNNSGDTAAKAQPSSVNGDSGKGSAPDSAGGSVDQGSGGSGGNGAQPAKTSTIDAKPSVAMTAKVEPEKVSSSQQQPLAALPTVIRFRSEMLRVQPTIVSFETAPVDLASALPSAPVQRQQPHPAKSSGLLGSLTVVLAGTVVPQPLMLGGFGIVPLAATWLFGLLLVILLTVFVFTYGSWLRRGGFATAARSDEPIFLNSLSIATPLLLGYVTSPWRMRSPILVVADIQSTHKLWFPTLTERRIRI